MPSRNIIDRLKAGDILLLDGATGSEIQRRGFDVARGATKEADTEWQETFGKGWNGDAEGITDPLDDWAATIGPWGAPANLDAPDIVRSLHEDYLKIGADIIISNNFYSSRSMMAMAGEEGRWEECTRRGGELAVEVRNAVKPEAYVAGGFAASHQVNTVAELGSELKDMARVLTGTGVDFLILEYFGGDTMRDPIEDCQVALDACAGTNLPVFLGLCWVQKNGRLHRGQSFSDLLKALKGQKLDGVFLMCSSPPAISACLPNLRKAFDGPVGAYAQAGYKENPKYGAAPGEPFFLIDEKSYPPKRYAEYALEWKKMGAQIIGGCCATGPEHIVAVRDALKK
jgi:homocysteine S-methyltransferase